MHSAFVPLRIFSSYTMLDGAIEPKAIAKRAQELGFPAAALTDRNGLYAAMAFSDGCKASGVQPIIGTMLGVARPDMPEGVEVPLDWLALYAQDETGYQNLCALVSRAHLDRPLELLPHVDFAALEGRTDGLIALTAGGEGGLTRLIAEGQNDRAIAYEFKQTRQNFFDRGGLGDHLVGNPGERLDRRRDRGARIDERRPLRHHVAPVDLDHCDLGHPVPGRMRAGGLYIDDRKRRVQQCRHVWISSLYT